MSFTLTLIRDFVTDLRRTPSVAFRRLQLKKSHQLAVGYIGWVGHNNLGDEAMFGAVGKAMSRFEVLDLLPEPGEHLLTKLGLGGPAIFRAVLLGGGTLINPLYLRVAQMIRKFNLPLYTVGTGIGNPGFGASSPDHSLEGWADILRESPLVSVRGPLSAHRLRQAGIAHTEIIGDPALAFTPETEPPFRSRRQLVINLTQESGSRYGTGDYEIFRQVGKLAGQFLASGGEVVGVALGRGDRQILEAFRHQNNIGNMRVEDHRCSTGSLLQTLEGSYALISVRLHAAVFASCAGVPSVLLAYRSKCRDFMSSMELESFAVPLSRDTGVPQLQECFTQILARPELGRQIYRKALFWKGKQQEYYSRLSAQIEKVVANHSI